MNLNSLRWPLLCVGALVGLAAGLSVRAQEEPAEKPAFARTTIDMGIVVSDVEKAVAFYREGLGFTELDGFDVPASLAADSGLSDNQPFHVHVMVLGKDETATKIKLMQFEEAPGRKVDNSFIHSSYGMSYLTIFVNDIASAVERAKRQGTEPLAKGPVPLPGGNFLALVRDPDGNMIELVGPRP